jgi:DNA-binding beta-propeller fold protein YncE
MKKIPLIILALLMLMSCGAPQVAILDKSKFVWPQPPARPRIRMIDVIITDRDFKKSTMSETLFGETVTFAFRKPHGIVADKRGIIYVSDTGLGTVFTIDLKNGATGKLFNSSGYKLPLGLSYDGTLDWIAVADGVKKIVTVTDLAAKKEKLVLGLDVKFGNPVKAAFDPQRERIYVADTGLHKIWVFDFQGKHIMDIGKKGSAPGHLFFPTGVAVNKEGNIYVVNSFNFRYDIFDPDGKFIRSIGGHGDRPGMFARPKALDFDSDGNVYVTDAAFNNFQIFDKDDTILLFVGLGGTIPGAFQNIYSIYIDKTNDYIYTTDQTNKRIQIFQYISDARWEEEQRAKPQ